MNVKLIILGIGLVWGGCYVARAQSAHFSYFSYEGKDLRFEQPFSPANQYQNPVIAGFYPDPSVCRKGDTYYLVNSSFAFFPGVPLFESKDLVSWKQAGHVLDRDSQLPLQGNDVSAGIFAPAIEYNKKNDTFYMVTMNMGNYTVFYVKSKDPAKGWSEPIHLKEGGMDPSFFFDEDGKGYLVYTTRPFGGQNYPGEMAIHMNEFCTSGDSICSKSVELVRGGTNIELQPQWLEGPHMYRVGKYYYLMCAEGGTGNEHTEVIFRSKNPYGPWESCPNNPILSQSKEADNPFPVSSTGHADLIQTKEGDWWSVFLGCRPYESDFYNTGRETFLLPVTWKDGWPTILQAGKTVPGIGNKPNLKTDEQRPTGNRTYTDLFNESSLDKEWMFLRNPKRECYHLTKQGITIDAQPANIYQKESISAIFRRQQHTRFTATTEVNFTPHSEKDLAGMVALQNEAYNFVFGKTILNGRPSLVLSRTEKEKAVIGTVILNEEEADLPIQLRIAGDGKYYTFYYRTDSGEWHTLAQGIDASNLSTHKAGGFIGTMIGLYVTSNQ